MATEPVGLLGDTTAIRLVFELIRARISSTGNRVRSQGISTRSPPANHVYLANISKVGTGNMNCLPGSKIARQTLNNPSSPPAVTST